tara:strand:+ start:2294 stop:2491 length:198 start_codon:yes stop_codon:yes gene_type:complete
MKSITVKIGWKKPTFDTNAEEIRAALKAFYGPNPGFTVDVIKSSIPQTDESFKDTVHKYAGLKEE